MAWINQFGLILVLIFILFPIGIGHSHWILRNKNFRSVWINEKQVSKTTFLLRLTLCNPVPEEVSVSDTITIRLDGLFIPTISLTPECITSFLIESNYLLRYFSQVSLRVCIEHV